MGRSGPWWVRRTRGRWERSADPRDRDRHILQVDAERVLAGKEPLAEKNKAAVAAVEEKKEEVKAEASSRGPRESVECRSQRMFRKASRGLLPLLTFRQIRPLRRAFAGRVFSGSEPRVLFLGRGEGGGEENGEEG